MPTAQIRPSGGAGLVIDTHGSCPEQAIEKAKADIENHQRPEDEPNTVVGKIQIRARHDLWPSGRNIKTLISFSYYQHLC
jgi:hypothetical protein